MSDLGSLSTSLTTYYQSAINRFQQNLFNKVDANGDGSVTKIELEQAVTGNGGSSASADALYAVLDPSATGSVSETQFAQNLPSLPFSDQIGAQLIADQSQRSIGAWSGGPGSQVAQTLFSQIDANGDGSISKTELEQAVTKAGGTTEAADALYAQLDPNNTGSVSEQQFAQSLSQAAPHHHHHHHHPEGDGGGSGAQDALASLLGGPSGTAASAQSVFTSIDTNGDGSISQTELEQAVTKAGGTSQAADALYAQLDPGKTGSVTEQTFAQFVQPPSVTGTTAEDAVLALLQGASPGAASASAPATSGGNSAQDALSALLRGLDTAQSGTGSSGGTSATDAWLALLNGGPGGSLGTSWDSLTQDPLLAASGATGTPSLGDGGNTAQDALLALLNGSAGSLTNSKFLSNDLASAQYYLSAIEGR